MDEPVLEVTASSRRHSGLPGVEVPVPLNTGMKPMRRPRGCPGNLPKATAPHLTEAKGSSVPISRENAHEGGWPMAALSQGCLHWTGELLAQWLASQ